MRVYQAYSPNIALPALRSGRFVSPPFSMNRMTWIKPSFCWMMYRSGFATKPGQETVLGIDISREGFEWALNNAVLSRFLPAVHGTYEHWRSLLSQFPVRIQWDPERDWQLRRVPDVRAIQIGLSGEAVELYVNKWFLAIEDVTHLAREVEAARETGVPPVSVPSQTERAYPRHKDTLSAILSEC